MRKAKNKKLGRPASPAGGYSYHCDMQAIKKYMTLSAKQKLEWLEEANHFLYKFTPRKTRKIWEKFRQGHI